MSSFCLRHELLPNATDGRAAAAPAFRAHACAGTAANLGAEVRMVLRRALVTQPANQVGTTRVADCVPESVPTLSF